MAERPRTGVQVLEQTDTRLAKPWKVIVHNDPINLMVYVTHVFMQVFGYPRPKAETHMLEVHHQGRSILWTGGREQAEVYAMKLRAAHLLTTLEPVEDPA
jgi:ATP-dependent Clp protease adaptor protein ClpS